MDNNAWTRYMNVTTHPDNDKTIAGKVGVSPSTIGRWRSGEIDPKPRQVVALARAYGKSPLAALVAASYLSKDDIEEDLTLHYAADLDEISSLQLLDELRRRMDSINDYTGWIQSIAQKTGSPANMTAGALRYVHPGAAPSRVDGMDFINPLEANLTSEEIDGHTFYKVNFPFNSSINDLPLYHQERIREAKENSDSDLSAPQRIAGSTSFDNPGDVRVLFERTLVKYGIDGELAARGGIADQLTDDAMLDLIRIIEESHEVEPGSDTP